MIRLALEECKKIGIDRVLMVCYKDNIGSRKSGVRIDIWTHFMRECIINYVH